VYVHEKLISFHHHPYQHCFTTEITPHDFFATIVVEARLELTHGRAKHLSCGRFVFYVMQQACQQRNEEHKTPMSDDFKLGIPPFQCETTEDKKYSSRQ
jgi:hypothetical protein